MYNVVNETVLAVKECGQSCKSFGVLFQQLMASNYSADEYKRYSDYAVRCYVGSEKKLSNQYKVRATVVDCMAEVQDMNDEILSDTLRISNIVVFVLILQKNENEIWRDMLASYAVPRKIWSLKPLDEHELLEEEDMPRKIWSFLKPLDEHELLEDEEDLSSDADEFAVSV